MRNNDEQYTSKASIADITGIVSCSLCAMSSLVIKVINPCAKGFLNNEFCFVLFVEIVGKSRIHI